MQSSSHERYTHIGLASRLLLVVTRLLAHSLWLIIPKSSRYYTIRWLDMYYLRYDCLSGLAGAACCAILCPMGPAPAPFFGVRPNNPAALGGGRSKPDSWRAIRLSLDLSALDGEVTLLRLLIQALLAEKAGGRQSGSATSN